MKLRVILWVVVILVATCSSRAQTPRTLSYQGVLTDTTGAPRPDGVYSFTFRLYSISSGGTPVWTETKSTQVKHGLFSTILGSVTPLPDSVTFNQQYWLGIQVSSDPELLPRIQLTSVGSSLNALRADVAQTVPDNSLTAAKIASGQVVKSINNLHDDLTMRGANGASVTTIGDTITITAAGGGGGGIGTIQNTNNTITITNPSGPTATVNVKVPLALSGSGAYNAPGAARFDLYNTIAGNGYLQHVTDTGTWQIATTNGAATRYGNRSIREHRSWNSFTAKQIARKRDKLVPGRQYTVIIFCGKRYWDWISRCRRRWLSVRFRLWNVAGKEPFAE